MVLIECTPELDHVTLCGILEEGGLYGGINIIMSPHLLGFPSKRMRKYMLMISKADFVVGIERPLDTFKELFFQEPTADSGIYLVASTDEKYSFCKRLRSQTIFKPDDMDADLSNLCLVPA